MPGYKSHLAAGAVTFVALFSTISIPISFETGFELLCCTLFGALFPDIDIQSKGQKIFYLMMMGVLGMLLLSQRWVIAAFLGFVLCLPLIVSHRSLFHRWWFILSLPVVLFFVLVSVYPFLKNLLVWDMIFFLSGIISHLILDRVKIF